MSDLQSDFSEAIRLRDRGDMTGSLEILSRISKLPDATAAVYAVLGGLHWDLGNLPDAIKSFEVATKMVPRYEVASLGLFHTLLESGRDDEAFAEMKRFLLVADSQEYRTLKSDFRKANDDP